MNLKRHLAISFFISLFLILSGCNGNAFPETEAPMLSAPPVEGENSAPEIAAIPEEKHIAVKSPNGLCALEISFKKVTCYDTQGQFISTFSAPDVEIVHPHTFHLASLMKGSPSSMIYLSSIPEQKLLLLTNTTLTVIRDTAAFLGMAGAPGQAAVAYSEVIPEDKAVKSHLFAGDIQSIASSEAIVVFEDERTGMAILPISIEALGSQPMKIWYTYTAWNIGSPDQIFPINRSLYEVDMSTEKNIQLLGSDRNFQGLSPDHNLAGSISFQLDGDRSMQVVNLISGATNNFPLKPESDRGAGMIVFSENGEYAAWLEMSGSIFNELPENHSFIRIGNISKSSVISEISDEMVTEALDLEYKAIIKLVGWLNSNSLVIEISDGTQEKVLLVSYNLTTRRLLELCQGSFLGFTYP